MWVTVNKLNLVPEWIIPIDVVMVMSCVNSLLNTTGILVWVAVNKLNLVLKWIIPNDVVTVMSCVNNLLNTTGIFWCGSQSINLILSRSGLCAVLKTCSETSEVPVQASFMSLSCSFINS